MAIKEAFAINKVFPLGEKNVGVAIEFDEELDAKVLSIDTFEVENRIITGIYYRTKFADKKGNFIVLDLDSNSKNADIRQTIGVGSNTRTKVVQPQIHVKQKKALVTKSGANIRVSESITITKQFDEDLMGFQTKSYKTKNGDILKYNLYIPKIKPYEKYPIVLFMADASVVSDDAQAPLIQGMGGIVWAQKKEQEKRPCFVLIPAYTQKTAFDDYSVTWECEETVNLLKEVMQQSPIDKNRVYGTGQSMGCMMLYEMMSTHLNLFAACYMVAGQWQPEKISKLMNQKFWILISEKDEKAYPIMSESVTKLEKLGAKVAVGHLDAKSDESKKIEFVHNVLSQNAPIQFTWYEGTSNLPNDFPEFPGCYHIFTWLWAYDIEPIREWLFKQIKN